MKLEYTIRNDGPSDFPLAEGEAWKFVLHCEDEEDAWQQMEKVKYNSNMFMHSVMNVYLDGRMWDAREWYTEGANHDNFPYDDTVVVTTTNDETKGLQ